MGLHPSEVSGLISPSDRLDMEPDDFMDDDGDCTTCGGDGFIFDCFDGFCIDCDIGCDDCTQPCPDCANKAEDAA